MLKAREFDIITDLLCTGAETRSGDDGTSIWFINVPYEPALSQNLPAHLTCHMITPYCDQARDWRDAGYNLFKDCDQAYEDNGAPDRIILRAEKQSAATQAMLAAACRYIAQGGELLAWAPNDAGGRQLPKYVQQMGLSCRKEGRHHCTYVIARCDRDSLDDEEIANMRTAGDVQLNTQGYYSCPGLHSWRRPDTGSAMLAMHLPGGLEGNGADLGCGWGYLSCEIVQRMQNNSHFYMIDNDARALKAAAMTMQAGTGAQHLHWQTLWRDMRQPHDMPADLDWIVMNPPFHNGRAEDIALGRAFIAGATRCLRKGGGLYMVANRKLAYEDNLKQHFAAVEKVREDNGYKIFYARK